MPTIGVALAIPEPWASELQDYRTSVGDTTATMIPTHITLVPPTEVDEADLPGRRGTPRRRGRPARAVSRSTCAGTGTFRPVSPVVFVTVAEGISQCEQLAAAVRQGPLAMDLQFPYHPHVTIAHHLPDDVAGPRVPELASFDSVFDATEFHLYVHDEETGWKPTRDFPLQPIPAVS